MDTKRRMPDLVHPVMASSSSSLLTSSHQAQALSSLPRPSPLPMLPWPVLQRRRIEKLKDDRLDEFGRACDENFEWLENYYQGCVYAAQRNRDYHEQEAAEVFGRSMSTDNGGSRTSQHFATDRRYDDDGMPFSPYTSGYYSGAGRSTASPGRHSLPQHRQQRQQQQRQKMRHTPKNSPAKFRLKSPKTPNVARIGSPISPYERQLHHHRQAAAAHHASHIHTTPRKKLRVTARPSSMRAQRALKAQRKRTASFQKDTGRQQQQKQQVPQQQKQHREHRDSKMDQQHEDHEQHRQEQQQHNQEQHRMSGADDTAKRRDSSPVTLKKPQQQQQQQLKKEDPRRQSLDMTRKQSSNQDQDMGAHSRHTPTTPADDRSFKSEADRSFKSEADKSYNSEIDKSFYGGSFIAELRASTFKTPAKGRSIRNERATNDREVDGEIDEYRSMPGSKARDSMTLKSPVNRSDISMDQDTHSPLRTSLGIHNPVRNRSPSSVTKRGSDLMETDQDRLVDAESKRSKSSPFLDSHVPIRFHSPEAESRTTTKSEGSTRQEWTKFNDSTSTSSAPRSAERSSAESASRWREPEAESLSAKNRLSDTNEQPPAASTTPTTTPHQRYGSSFTERPVTSSDEPTRGASLRHGTQDKPNDAGIARSTHDSSSALHGQVNGDSAKHRTNGDSARRQADYIDSHTLPGNHQDHPPLRQAEQKKEEDNTLPTNRPGRFGVGDDAEQNARSKPATTTTTAATKPESTAFSSSFIGSSDAGSLRSKAPMTLPEKRTLGTRRPVGTSSNALTSAFLPLSRLTKLTSTDLTGGAGSTTESKVLTAPQPDTSTIQTSSSSRVARVGTQSTLKDTQQSGAGPNGIRPPTVPTTSSNSTTGLLGRQASSVRPPMTSGRVAAETSGVNGTTSNGVSRSDNQGSHLQRKHFAIPSSTVTTTTTSTNKSVFSLKKTTGRPVLPDGVSSALLASSSSSSTSTRPPSSSLAMMQARMDQHARESTPTQDYHSKSSHSTAQQRTELKATAAGSSTLSLSSVISSRKESMTTAGNGARTDTTQGSSKANVAADGGHIFAVPAPVRQPMAQSWMSNSAQQERRHFKTILPEINSDGEDHDVNNNDESMRSSKRKKATVPDWTSWEELYRQMENQKNLNPEEIFGPIPMLDVAEIFPGREKKMSFRSRTSSAHWGASDALTPQEVTKYNEDMGWSGQE